MFAIQHVIVYRYARPVRIGLQRLMFRPRDSHDLRLLNSTLTVSPPAKRISWTRDVWGNSIAVAEFDCETDELRLQSDIVLEHFPPEEMAFEIADYARIYPFSYAVEEMPDLARLIERHYSDPEQCVARWARQFALSPDGGQIETRPMLERMMRAIKDGFVCAPRDEDEVQTPAETLARKRGSCRDFAVLMVEGVRSLGLAARFVSGYVYDPTVEAGSAADPVPRGGENGAVHAWLQVYLPGAGWVEFDPSNAIVDGKNLIRIAIARDAAQAMPVSSGFRAPADRLSVEVCVRISAHENLTGLPMPEPPAPPTFTDVAVQPGKGGAQSVAV